MLLTCTFAAAFAEAVVLLSLPCAWLKALPLAWGALVRCAPRVPGWEQVDSHRFAMHSTGVLTSRLEAPVDRELLKGSTPLLLLSLLCEGPMYGYQIIETVRQRTGGTYTLKEGALYPALHKLEATEFISSYWETQENGRERRYYALLPAGEAFLTAKKREWNQFVDMVQAFVGPKA